MPDNRTIAHIRRWIGIYAQMQEITKVLLQFLLHQDMNRLEHFCAAIFDCEAVSSAPISHAMNNDLRHCDLHELRFRVITDYDGDSYESVHRYLQIELLLPDDLRYELVVMKREHKKLTSWGWIKRRSDDKLVEMIGPDCLKLLSEYLIARLDREEYHWHEIGKHDGDATIFPPLA